MTVVLKREVLQEHIARHMPSQNAFARKAQISRGYCAQILSGKRSPSGNVRLKLLKATRLQFDDLFQIVHPSQPNGSDNSAAARQ